MGLWGAAQAVAFGLGGLAGAAAVDVARLVLGQAEAAYAVVFVIDAALFIASAMLAARINRPKISKTGGFGPMVPAR
jgi:BCD family chlorophyll transporter-like MFS transporter